MSLLLPASAATTIWSGTAELHLNPYSVICLAMAAGFTVVASASRMSTSNKPGASALHFVAAMLRHVAPVAAICAAVILLLARVPDQRPDKLSDLAARSSDWAIVQVQRHRADSLEHSDVLLIGDSSCLMGIDAERAGLKLGARVESLCSLAWIGPAGYAQLLARHLRRTAKRVDVVLLLSPSALERPEDHRQYENLEAASGRHANDPIQHSLRTGRTFLEQVFYTPLPKAYGRYFGGRFGFSNHIARNHGSTVDPTAGLEYSSLAEYLEARVDTAPATVAELVVSQEFTRSAARFAETMRAFPHANLWLGITPFPGGRLDAGSTKARSSKMVEAARSLHIHPSRLLQLPPTLPGSDFATPTHLHRWARILYTDAFAAELKRTLR